MYKDVYDRKKASRSTIDIPRTAVAEVGPAMKSIAPGDLLLIGVDKSQQCSHSSQQIHD